MQTRFRIRTELRIGPRHHNNIQFLEYFFFGIKNGEDQYPPPPPPPPPLEPPLLQTASTPKYKESQAPIVGLEAEQAK